MIRRSFDLDLLLRATKVPTVTATEEDFRNWFANEKNLMFSDGENVGLATYEYPGLYSVHWFFTVRGRKALDLGRAMLVNLFENYGAEAVRGFIKSDLKASRWAARQVGLKSLGLMECPDGTEDEIFYASKKEYLNG